MKISRSTIRKIIKEELNLLVEGESYDPYKGNPGISSDKEDEIRRTLSHLRDQLRYLPGVTNRSMAAAELLSAWESFLFGDYRHSAHEVDYDVYLEMIERRKSQLEKDYPLGDIGEPTDKRIEPPETYTHPYRR